MHWTEYFELGDFSFATQKTICAAVSQSGDGKGRHEEPILCPGQMRDFWG
jgi:hypothetical protein